MLDIRDRARAAMKARTKIVKRKSLAGDKVEGGGYLVARKGNMISFTGYEAGGSEMSPSSVTSGFMFFFLAMICVHLFTKNTPYRSANPFK